MWSIRKTTFFCFFMLMGFSNLKSAHAHLENLSLDLPSSSDVEEVIEIENDRSSSPHWNDYFTSHLPLKGVKLAMVTEGNRGIHLNSKNAMVPASVLKVITAAASLTHLGNSFRFENRFEAQINSQNQELFVPRFVISGDPTWGMEYYDSGVSENERIQSRLAAVIETLKKNNIKKVIGPLKIQATHPELNRIPFSPAWKNSWRIQCMAMVQTSFAMNGNCGTIQINSVKEARWLTEGVQIPIQLKLKNSNHAENDLLVEPHYDQQERIVEYIISGYLSSRTRLQVPVHQSEAWLKNIFISGLKKNGIQYIETGASQKGSPISVDLSSLPLNEVLKIAVSHSINGVMDRLFEEVGYRYSPADHSLPSREILRNQGIPDLQSFQIFDGSGLDLRNRVTADGLYSFLSQMRSSPLFRDFLSTFAVAGVSGTLAGRLQGEATKGKVFAKTGTIDGIINLAGYALSADQHYEPFVILTQSSLSTSQARVVVDGLVSQMVKGNSQ